MDKSKIYLDLSKCTEDERKSLTPILKKAGEHICYPIEKSDNNLLSFSPHCNGWNPFREVYSKQELTYPEFIKLFEGGESKEVLQVDNTVFNIDFGGHVMAGLKIVNGEIEVVGAMNGYGNGISTDEIRITKYNQ